MSLAVVCGWFCSGGAGNRFDGGVAGWGMRAWGVWEACLAGWVAGVADRRVECAGRSEGHENAERAAKSQGLSDEAVELIKQRILGG